ncbi:MAG: DUF2161 family putative PD-(D/E)XK-type phosphodiesterase [Bacilli bacterium]
MAIIKETELYIPIKQFLEEQGYQVRGEVNGCDIVAVKIDEEPIIIELKKTFSLDLVLQGVNRLHLSNNVYLAIERPKKNSKRWTSIKQLCRRLGVGLVTVRFSNDQPLVDVVCSCDGVGHRTNRKLKDRLLDEFHRRSGDHNVGGSTKIPLITAYREEALMCAMYIKETGPSKASDIRDATKISKARNILYDNHYRWFTNTARGIYDITPEGERALTQYVYVIQSENDNEEE